MKEAARKHRRMTTVPVTTMEEIPVLDESERAALLDSLKEAEAQIEAGQATEYHAGTFRDRLLRIYRAKKR